MRYYYVGKVFCIYTYIKENHMLWQSEVIIHFLVLPRQARQSQVTAHCLLIYMNCTVYIFVCIYEYVGNFFMNACIDACLVACLIFIHAHAHENATASDSLTTTKSFCKSLVQFIKFILIMWVEIYHEFMSTVAFSQCEVYTRYSAHHCVLPKHVWRRYSSRLGRPLPTTLVGQV